MKKKKIVSQRKKTRNLLESRAQILGAAFSEIYAHGFQGCSIDDILAKTNLTKGALFHQFPSKLELGYAVASEVLTQMILDRWVDPLKEYKNPIDGILKQMHRHIGGVTESDWQRGCPLNNLVQEMSGIDKGFQERLTKTIDLWIDGIQGELQRGIREGAISEKTNTRSLAEYFVMFHEGLYGFLKAKPDRRTYNSLFKNFKKSLQGYLISN